MPYFSIIIPVYNVAPYLRECLDSVLAQTFTDWEAICVDDGSTDGSGEVIEAYDRLDSRIRVIRQPNSGVSYARNVGISNSHGDWIIPLDGDDKLHPQALALLAAAIKSNDYDVIRLGVCRVAEHFESGEWPMYEDENNFTKPIRKDCATINLFFNAGVATAVRRDIVCTTPFHNISNGEDVLWCVECYGKASRIGLTKYPLYYYLVSRESSATHQRTLGLYRGLVKYLVFLCSVIKEWPDATLYRKVLAKRLNNCVGGSVLTMLKALEKEDRSVAWCVFWRELEFTLTSGYPLGRGARALNWLVFKCKSKLLAVVFLEYSVWIKANILRIVKIVKEFKLKVVR